MEYTKDGFYDPYKRYLRDSLVRLEHDRIFKLFVKLSPDDIRAVDFGCATCEFGEFIKKDHSFVEYTGIDLHALDNHDPVLKVVQGDYRDAKFDSLFATCNVFVSVFSTECHLSASEKYGFYERMFSFPSMQIGLVSGFVYDQYPEAVKIQERMGFDVYQTVESQINCRSKVFDELRYYTRVPPGMFKDTFTEVWKVLVRR